MADEKQNGPQMPQKPPEGELFLFVRLNPKTSEFQCLYSDLMSAMALHKMAGLNLDTIVKSMFAGPQIALPELKLPTLEEIRKRGA